MTLSTRIVLLALLNLALPGAVLLLFAVVQLRVRPEDLLFAPAHDRIVSLGRDVALELEQIAPSARDDMMRRYSTTYGVNIALYSNDADKLAGNAGNIPPQVREEVVRRPRGGGAPEAPPPPPPPGGGRRPAPGGNLSQLSADGLFWVGMHIPLPGPEGTPIHGIMLLSAPSFFGTPLFFDYKPWVLGLIAMTAVFVVCWLPFIRGLTRSVVTVTCRRADCGRQVRSAAPGTSRR